MLAAALVDPVHDGAHHLRMSHCHLLLFPWHIPPGPGEASHDYSVSMSGLVTKAQMTNLTQSQPQPQTDRAKDAIKYDILLYPSC